MVRKVLPEIVSNQDVFELDANAKVQEAVRGMAEKNVHSVLVTDGGRLIGIFTSTDLVLKVVAVGLEPNMTTFLPYG